MDYGKKYEGRPVIRLTRPGQNSLRFKGRRPFWPKTDDSVLVKDGKDDSTSTQISLLFSAETGQGLILEVKVALN